MSFLLLWSAFAPAVLSLLLTSVIYFCNNGEKKEAQTSRGDGGEVPRGKKKIILVNIELFAQNLNFYITLS
jgi:hypothetical protein